MYKIEEMSPEKQDGDESDKHIKARDRRYSCLKKNLLTFNQFLGVVTFQLTLMN